MDTSAITTILIFKDGYYYLTVKAGVLKNGDQSLDCYVIAPDNLAIYNGFEFASDAYAYLAKLQTKKKVV